MKCNKIFEEIAINQRNIDRIKRLDKMTDKILANGYLTPTEERDLPEVLKYQRSEDIFDIFSAVRDVIADKIEELEDKNNEFVKKIKEI